PGRKREEAAAAHPQRPVARAACLRCQMGPPQWPQGRVRQHDFPTGSNNMSEKLSISGDDDDWQIFSKAPQSGKVTLFRSRTRNPKVKAFAAENQMARIRCVLAPDQVAESGMPKSTKDLDDFEDSLLGALTSADVDVSLIAVVTGEGNR